MFLFALSWRDFGRYQDLERQLESCEALTKFYKSNIERLSMGHLPPLEAVAVSPEDDSPKGLRGMGTYKKYFSTN